MWTEGMWIGGEFIGRAAVADRHNDAALIVAAVNALPGLLERIERLEEALEDYGEHRIICRARIARNELNHGGLPTSCDCGLDAALKGA